MTTYLATIIADFKTALATKLSVGGSSCSIQSVTDDDGNTIPNGTYFFTIDGDSAEKEHIVCTVTSTAISSISSVSRQGVQSANAVREHRIGASVEITNFAHIKYLNDLMDGTTNFDASTPLGYDGVPSLTYGNNEFVTWDIAKDYTDGVAIAGAPDASISTKGISKLSTAPVSATDPIVVGDNDIRMPLTGEAEALVGSSGTPSSTNVYITEADVTEAKTASKIARRDSNGDILVATTPTAGDAAISKTYLESIIGPINKKIITNTAQVSFLNTTTETTILATTIAGGTLGINNGVKFKIFVGELDLNGGGSQTFWLRLKYGSSVVLMTYATTAGVTDSAGYISGYILASGATNTQKMYIDIDTGKIGAAVEEIKYLSFGTGSQDSTTDKTLSVTLQFNTASGANKMVTEGYVVEQIA